MNCQGVLAHCKNSNNLTGFTASGHIYTELYKCIQVSSYADIIQRQ